MRTTRKALFLRGALLPLLVFLAACKPQNAANPAPRGPAPSELIRLAVWPDEDTRWQVCESTWEEFAKGGYLETDIYVAASRYVLSVPVKGVEGEFRLVLPLAAVVLECGRLALEGTRPYRSSNRPPLMIHQPLLHYRGPERPPQNWEAWLFLRDDRGEQVGYVASSRLEEPLCLAGECSGGIVFLMVYPSKDLAQVTPSLEGGFFLEGLDRGRDLFLRVDWGEVSTEVPLDLGGLHGAPQAGSR
uniref:SH3 domain-containing protein n=1 Tax=Thermus caliditerrae TaxID=1330700 RepID=A0A7C5VIQ3_9DEIN